jgi:flavin reductase (DIM6/NTAB) family NADH-FMN oxidoreductase RutF
MKAQDHLNSKDVNFEELFRQITPESITKDVFTLAGKIFPVITAGNEYNYNSMAASGGGLGVMFKKPATWCIFQSQRYTLEMILKFQTYTLSYFSDEYKEEIFFLGSKSGRESKKMKEVKLRSIQTPCGNISFKEAFLIIECKLIQVTCIGEDDFYSQDAINYVSNVYKDSNEYRKYVFGEIINVWEKTSV